ncbi:polyphosphate kinase 2 family protein [Pinibacter soli]|uniref:Polyphosphate kinase 2 family protein n=1 Tax=Pinibacter soli TaxID=3044211 RepID=A0ABT6RAK3_9BACT|nr:polyphosphate kinase 2 family protein [Pinibacter soli]MDI3319583.1 polyphosphate kinase 2 family protein [Pinibacter soli]
MKVKDKLLEYLDECRVKPGKEVNLKKYKTDFEHEDLSKEEGAELLEFGIQKLAEMQDKLYAHNKYSVLIIFQAMDAAGKDGAIKHVMSGLNPQGVQVTSFKAPTSHELEHDYLWRHYIALPPRGEIGIFNRSHYENVLVTRVHPEYLLGERLPEVKSEKDIDQSFWDKRFEQINCFEKTLADNGTVILKFFLHLSKKEQKKRFLERIDNPEKNWKFSSADLKERAYWKDYRKAYEDAISNTSKDYAPWFVVPADDKWFARLVIAAAIYYEFQKLDISYPIVSAAQKDDLMKAKDMLMKEGEENGDGSS